MAAVLNKENLSDFKSPVVENENTISVIIPIYNEEKSIKNVVEQLQEVLSNSGTKYEIIVIDDGSTDRSPEVLKGIDGITSIRHPKNIGYGGAIKTGMKNAKGDIIVITDGDGTYPNEMIPELLKDIGENDMVVGARSKSDSNIPLMRKPIKWLLGKLANYLSETDIPDLNSGLRVFKKNEALRFYRMFPSGFSFTTTITLAMHCNGYNVKYVPIKYGKREGKSKINPIKDTLNFIQLIWRTIMYFSPLKVFLPIAGIIFVGFMVSSFIDIFISENLTDKTVILFLAFIQVSVLGLLADLIVKRTP
ncbi:MAG TPA: glycosyltransferase family 2 protein [Thermodesulfobacteriota bacterium]|nr:glycosyltransferase family 2 protein [Thermodesulfobacteriota bacterium]